MSGMKNEDLLMLYTSGKGYFEFIETNSGFYKESILSFKQNVLLPVEFVDEIRALDQEKYFLAIAEPWCENCVINVTLLEVAAEINEKINFRIVPQTDMGNYMIDMCNEHQMTMPIIFELSSFGDIVGIFCGQPKVLRQLGESAAVVRTAMKKKYKQGGLAEEIVRELLKI